MSVSAISSVALYLGGMLLQEAQFLGGVTDQIAMIKSEMMRMQCFLKDADEREDESAVFRNRVIEIRDLAYDVENAIDNYIIKAKDTSFFNPKKYIRRHKIGKKINTLQSRIQDITRSVETYQFKMIRQGEGTSSMTEIRQQLRQSYPHYDEEDVIGIEDNIKVLVAELINKNGPRLVSIVGMGGLGKTTLAKKVYNHGDVKRHFDGCAWSFISQQFQVRTILQEIIRKVSNLKQGTTNVRELTETLYKLLEDKCYLVVLDDIWSTETWDVLKYAFPKGKMGSKIMLTTRIKNVALYVEPSGFLHEPACLTEEQSWELLCKKTFLWKNVASSSSSSSYLPEVEKKEKLGRDMIKKCGGLPLAVVVLGGMLATKKSTHEWEMVANDISRYLNKPQQQQEEHGVSWILSLSYHDLPPYLKSCFLYLGLYPEDTEFLKWPLIQMWIAEDFVQHNGQGTIKQEMAEEFLLELINRSMVQVGERSFRGKVKTCHLHDLMRDLCLQKAKEENFLCTFDGGSSTRDDSFTSSTAVVESISTHRMHRHVIHFTCDRYVSMQQATRSSNLRAFSLWKPYFPHESVGTLEFVCKKFNFLRVLMLEDIAIDSLPTAIGDLIHLRYLRLKAYTNMKSKANLTGRFRTDTMQRVIATKVPPTIGNLRNLQFLTLYNIGSIPNVLWKMEQLSYCHCCPSTPGPYWYTHDNKPLQVDGLKNLLTLRLQWGEGLRLEFALPKLTNLRKLYLSDINGTECKSLHQLSISRLDHLQCLSLHFWSMSYGYDWSALSSCHSLWKLYLEGIMKLPQSEEFPSNLTKLVLVSSNWEEDPIPTLEKLPNLESLTISHGEDKITKYNFSGKGFRRLQYLRLFDIDELKELKVEKGAMPCLTHLQIKNCEKFRMLPEELKLITTLKKLEVIDMPDKFNERLQKDEDDWHKIQHIPSIIIRRTF